MIVTSSQLRAAFMMCKKRQGRVSQHQFTRVTTHRQCTVMTVILSVFLQKLCFICHCQPPKGGPYLPEKTVFVDPVIWTKLGSLVLLLVICAWSREPVSRAVLIYLSFLAPHFPSFFLPLPFLTSNSDSEASSPLLFNFG
jgi:hypothetical protein